MHNSEAAFNKIFFISFEFSFKALWLRIVFKLLENSIRHENFNSKNTL